MIVARQPLRERCEGILAAARMRDFLGFQEHKPMFHRTIIEAGGNGAVRRARRALAFEGAAQPLATHSVNLVRHLEEQTESAGSASPVLQSARG